MSTGRQGQPQGRHNGGSAGGAPQQGVREQIGEMGQGLREGAERVGDRLREGYDTAREQVGRGYRQAEGMMARNPSQSVLIGFGVGFGLGVLLTLALTQREETWWERNAPEPLRDLPDRIADALSRHLPRSLFR